MQAHLDTPLADAAEAGWRLSWQAVRRRLNKAADNGATAILIASLNGHLEVVKVLLGAGARQDAICNGKTALGWAEAQGHTAVAAALRAA